MIGLNSFQRNSILHQSYRQFKFNSQHILAQCRHQSSRNPQVFNLFQKKSVQITLGFFGSLGIYKLVSQYVSKESNEKDLDKSSNSDKFPVKSNIKDLKLVSRDEVENMLKGNEEHIRLTDKLSVFVNSIASNNPSEDYHFLHHSMANQLVVFGVIDGHAGLKCSQYLKEELPSWLLNQVGPLIGKLRSSNDYVDNISDSIRTSLLQLDHHLVNERIYSTTGELIKDNVVTASNGAVAIVGILDLTSDDLFVANVGDCRGVLGRLKTKNQWEAVALSEDHSFLNLKELARVLKDHPGEGGTIGWEDRYMGTLQPTRAFGDAWLKWRRDFKLSLIDYIPSTPSKMLNIPNYRTPPYPTALADVTHHKISKDDKFIVFGCDGLFDKLDSEEVVELVGGNLIKDGSQNREYRIFKDENLSTHLIRNCFRGWNEQYIQSLLSLQYPQSRTHRDDVTAMVLVFDD